MSISVDNGSQGHGFAVDARSNDTLYLADSDAGIYKLKNTNLGGAVKWHLSLLKQEMDIEAVYCYQLTLK